MRGGGGGAASTGGKQPSPALAVHVQDSSRSVDRATEHVGGALGVRLLTEGERTSLLTEWRK